MRKILLIVLTLFSLLFIPIHAAFAENKLYDVSVESIYVVEESGITRVTQKVELTNLTEFQFAESYELNIGLSDIQNVKATNLANTVTHIVKSNNGRQSILVSFKNRVVGKDKKNDFTIQFDTQDVAKKKGGIWDVTIPGVSNLDEFEEYVTTLKIPSSFGKPSVLKPEKKISDDFTYKYTKEEISGGIMGMFGDEQAYAFDLSYRLKNSNLFPVTTEIALPPNTNYQDVLINTINPKPLQVTQDIDGNWLASYALTPQQKLTIKVSGFAKLQSTPDKVGLTKEQKELYTQSQQYWEQNTTIKNISQKTRTPQDIYEYVVKSLRYDYKKVTEQNNRLGALGVLSKDASAVCLEFTDLFVALARASGIPARAVEGYAYTNDNLLRPLSLSQDILHAWPEYYDSTRSTWIMVDPTWGNTTGGSDYFSTLDFYHVAFVVKGRESTYPIPAGGYKDDQKRKDVVVNFVEIEKFKPRSALTLTSSFPDFVLSGLPVKGKVTVKNTGNTALMNKKLIIKPDDGKEKVYTVETIPPFGTKDIPIELSVSSFLTNKTHRLRISIDNVEDIRVFRTGIVPEDSRTFVIGGGVFLVSLIGLTIFTIKARSVSVPRRKR